MAQIAEPIKNDFYSTVSLILTEVNIQKSWEEIKNMDTNRFKNLVKEKCIQTAFLYLTEKQKKGSKGRDIKYTSLEMADYLLPQANMSLTDQRELFSVRCHTNDLGANRGIIEYCETECGEILNNSHIFQCCRLNTPEEKWDLEKVLNGFIIEKKQHLQTWRNNMKKRDKYIGTQ